MPEQHLAFRNLGDLKFEDVSAAWGLNQRGISFGAALLGPRGHRQPGHRLLELSTEGSRC
jgi:hypothetical protein